MNKFVIFWGALAAISGLVMYYIVYSLGFETFRPDLVPYEQTALTIVVVGIVVTVVGLIARPFIDRGIGIRSASKYFLYGALVNSIAAAAFIAPILFPAFDFPILIAQWPGIYMVIAYTMFLVIGIFGMLGWAAVYQFLSAILSKSAIDRRFFLLQFALLEIGIYGLAVSMFVGGYAGATISYEGAGPAVIGAQMEIGVIPAGVSIFVLILSTVIGVVSVVTSKKEHFVEANQKSSLSSYA